jgi:hypothetical protein
MTSQHDKPKRWRPRFSVRTLVIVVTLVCVYAACWGPTKTKGVSDVHLFLVAHGISNARVPCPVLPLLIKVDPDFKEGEIFGLGSLINQRIYFVWCFGYVSALPI